MAAVSIQLMPAATARCSASCLIASGALIRMPPVTPPPKASSDIVSPVRPRKVFRIVCACLCSGCSEHDAGGKRRQRTLSARSLKRWILPVAVLGSSARIFVGRKRRLHVLLQRLRQGFAGLVGGLEDHERLGLDQ